MNWNTRFILCLVIVTLAEISTWFFTRAPSSSSSYSAFSSDEGVRKSPDWPLGQERAADLLKNAGEIPHLREFLLAKYKDPDDLAVYLVHDTTGEIGAALLSEARKELHAYDDLKTGTYQYRSRIENNCLAIYNSQQCLAMIPLSFAKRY